LKHDKKKKRRFAETEETGESIQSGSISEFNADPLGSTQLVPLAEASEKKKKREKKSSLSISYVTDLHTQSQFISRILPLKPSCPH